MAGTRFAAIDLVAAFFESNCGFGAVVKVAFLVAVFLTAAGLTGVFLFAGFVLVCFVLVVTLDLVSVAFSPPAGFGWEFPFDADTLAGPEGLREVESPALPFLALADLVPFAGFEDVAFLVGKTPAERVFLAFCFLGLNVLSSQLRGRDTRMVGKTLFSVKLTSAYFKRNAIAS